jgi:alpha-1,3-glucan synthase
MSITLFGRPRYITHGTLTSTRISRHVILLVCERADHSERLHQISNTRNTSCVLPQFWNQDGTVITLQTNGCLDSDFDQYGDTEAFGVHPDWQRQLSKFASVQDRLREWKPTVMSKLQVFACMAIQAFDIDAIRIDKSTQVTVQALAQWATGARQCATKLGKKNFYITGEVTGGDTFGSLY